MKIRFNKLKENNIYYVIRGQEIYKAKYIGIAEPKKLTNTFTLESRYKFLVLKNYKFNKLDNGPISENETFSISTLPFWQFHNHYAYTTLNEAKTNALKIINYQYNTMREDYKNEIKLLYQKYVFTK